MRAFTESCFDTVDLQQLHIASEIGMDREIIHDLRFQDFLEESARRLRLRLSGYVWAEPPKRIQCRYPATWWDAFKERWFPEWAIEAYPANYTIETLEGQIFYPKLPHTVPEHVHNLRMCIQKENERGTFHDDEF